MFRYMALAIVVTGTAGAIATLYGVARVIYKAEPKRAELSIREH